MRMDVHQSEDTDGIRFSWNVWPGSRLEATRAVVPVGCMYSPLKKISNLPLLGYDPVSCKSCSSVLNPYWYVFNAWTLSCHRHFSTVDVRTKLWVCPFCFQRNQLPPAYENINEQTLPPELLPQCTTIEYAVRKPPGYPPLFMFVIDTYATATRVHCYITDVYQRRSCRHWRIPSSPVSPSSQKTHTLDWLYLEQWYVMCMILWWYCY